MIITGALLVPLILMPHEYIPLENTVIIWIRNQYVKCLCYVCVLVLVVFLLAKVLIRSA